MLVDDPDADLGRPVISPDGGWVAYARETLSTPHEAPASRCSWSRWPAATRGRSPTSWDRWPQRPVWLPDGTASAGRADDDGRGPVFRVDLRDPARSRG